MFTRQMQLRRKSQIQKKIKTEKCVDYKDFKTCGCKKS